MREIHSETNVHKPKSFQSVWKRKQHSFRDHHQISLSNLFWDLVGKFSLFLDMKRFVALCYSRINLWIRKYTVMILWGQRKTKLPLPGLLPVDDCILSISGLHWLWCLIRRILFAKLFIDLELGMWRPPAVQGDPCSGSFTLSRS